MPWLKFLPALNSTKPSHIWMDTIVATVLLPGPTVVAGVILLIESRVLGGGRHGALVQGDGPHRPAATLRYRVIGRCHNLPIADFTSVSFFLAHPMIPLVGCFDASCEFIDAPPRAQYK